MIRRVILTATAMAIMSAPAAFGASVEKRICVRNYLKPEPAMDPCARGLPGFSYVLDKDLPDERICTKTYEDRHCKFSTQEFDHALTPEGEPVCTINFHQPPISANCASSPDLYQWVSGAYPD